MGNEINFSRVGNLAGNLRKIPKMVDYGYICMILGKMIENDKKWKINGNLR